MIDESVEMGQGADSLALKDIAREDRVYVSRYQFFVSLLFLLSRESAHS